VINSTLSLLIEIHNFDKFFFFLNWKVVFYCLHYCCCFYEVEVSFSRLLLNWMLLLFTPLWLLFWNWK
jgi:hypothetical protein